MDITRTKLFNVQCLQMENDEARVAVAVDTGHVLDYFNKRTGRHQLCISEKCVPIDYSRYGIQIQWVAKPRVAANDAGEIVIDAASATLEQTGRMAIEPQTGILRLTHTIENVSAVPQWPDPRIFYTLHPACQSERTAFHLPATAVYQSTFAAHGRQRLFVHREGDWLPEPNWPPHEYFENHEVGEATYSACSYAEHLYIRPRWFAALDTLKQEGVIVRFDRPAGFIRAHLPGYVHAPGITVEQDLRIGALGPGQSDTMQIEFCPVTGLERVDHVGPTCAAAIELTPTLRLDEVLRVTARATALRAGSVEGKLTIRTNKIEVEVPIRWSFKEPGRINEYATTFGPFGSRQQLETIFSYARKKVGDTARPTPRVELRLENRYAERWFVPSPDAEEILTRLEQTAEKAARRVESGESPREILSTIRAFGVQLEEVRRARIDPDAMYAILDRAMSVAQAGIAPGGLRLFDPAIVRAAAANDIVRMLLENYRSEVKGRNDAFYSIAAPGFDAMNRCAELSIHAANAAVCYTVFGDNDCGKRAARALAAFAEAYDRYRLTSAGNILHQSLLAMPLVIAFDLIHGLLTDSEEAGFIRFLIYLGDLLEEHSHAKGDNDEIHEAGGLAWIAARLAYLPDSPRKLRRAHAILCRQARVINGDGGWPESPNYNDMITIAYMVHAVLMRMAGMPIDVGDTGVALRGLLEWLTKIVSPNGQIPMLGDGVERRPAPETFFLAAALFNDGRYLTIAKRLLNYEQQFGSALFAIFRPIMLLSYPVKLAPEPVTFDKVIDLPHTGYLILRSGSEPDAEFLICDYGPYKPGHGHPDKLSFEFYAFRENLIRDPGYGFRSTDAHNLVVVDGANQGRIGGKLDRLETDASGLTRAVVSADIAPNVRHIRMFLYRPSRYLLIYDRLKSPERHNYSWRLNFNGAIAGSDRQFVYRSASGPGVIAIPGHGCARRDEAKAVVHSDAAGLSDRPIQRIVSDITGQDVDFIAMLVPFQKQIPQAALDWRREQNRAAARIGDFTETIPF